MKNSTYLYKLNSHQLLGVKYFYDMSQKIPREEVQKGERILKAAAKHMNPDLQITLCGSYRRGRAKSGDIDCLITHPQLKTEEDLTNNGEFLKQFVTKLTDSGYLVDHLTLDSKKKYMGLAEIKGVSLCPRRIDIRLIAYQSYAASLLYFTGSKNLNTMMRSTALSLGYTLNEYGLFAKLIILLTTLCGFFLRPRKAF